MRLLLLLPLLPLVSSFVVSPHKSSISILSALSKEDLRHDIDDLKAEADERIAHLLEQYEHLKELNKSHEGVKIESVKPPLESVVVVQEDAPIREPLCEPVVDAKTAAKKETEPIVNKPLESVVVKDVPREKTTAKKESTVNPKESTPIVVSEATTTLPKPRYDLLTNTTWKVVFNLGREPGTWMPKSWGASNHRAILQTTVKFTQQPGEYDEFFHGVALTAEVSDAFLFPRGVGASATGRRPLKVKTVSNYRVCPGQGPAGTDLLRLDLELLEDVQISDVRIPAGKIYGTLGYFDMACRDTKARDMMVTQHREIAHRVEMAKYTLEETLDSNPLQWETLGLVRNLWKCQADLSESTKNLERLNLQIPERRNLRMFGDVGLSKEGGVCCKIQSGFAIEYHILGRLEICSKDRHAI